MARRNRGDKWYVATLVFLASEKGRLLRAPNNEVAYKKAMALGEHRAQEERDEMADDPHLEGSDLT